MAWIWEVFLVFAKIHFIFKINGLHKMHYLQSAQVMGPGLTLKYKNFIIIIIIMSNPVCIKYDFYLSALWIYVSLLDCTLLQ